MDKTLIAYVLLSIAAILIIGIVFMLYKGKNVPPPVPPAAPPKLSRDAIETLYDYFDCANECPGEVVNDISDNLTTMGVDRKILATVASLKAALIEEKNGNTPAQPPAVYQKSLLDMGVPADIWKNYGKR